MKVEDAESIFLKALKLGRAKGVGKIEKVAEKSGYSISLFFGILMGAFDGLEKSIVPIDKHPNGNGSKLFKIIPRYKLNKSEENRAALYLELYQLKDILSDFGNLVFEKEFGKIKTGPNPSHWFESDKPGKGQKIIVQMQQILLETLELPDYARLEYLMTQQSESKFSLPVFFRFIEDACDSCFLKIRSEYPSACLDLFKSLENVIDLCKSLFKARALNFETEMLEPFRNKLADLEDLRTRIDAEQEQLRIGGGNDDARKGIRTDYTPPQLSVIFDKLLKIQYVSSSDRKNFIATFQDKPLPNGWKKIKWSGSRKDCFSFMMDMCGDSIKAQDINDKIVQYAKDRKTGMVNTNPLTPRDRTNCKRGFLDRLQ